MAKLVLISAFVLSLLFSGLKNNNFTTEGDIHFSNNVSEKDIADLQVIGVTLPDDEPARSRILLGYNALWDEYMKVSGLAPADIVLGMEISPCDLGDGFKYGLRYTVPQPVFFLNQHLFDIGVRQIGLIDPRERGKNLYVSDESQKLFIENIIKFTSRHGNIAIVNKNLAVLLSKQYKLHVILPSPMGN